QVNSFFFQNPTSVQVAYLRLPVNLAFQIKGFFVSAGPYIGLALFGQARQQAINMYNTNPGIINEQKVKFTDEVKPVMMQYSSGINSNFYLGQYDTGYYPLRRMDAGLQGNIGYGFKKVRITAFIELGLTNTLPKYVESKNPSYSVKNRAFGVAATYFLGIRE
ncbi:MAG: hypothetical protein ABIQ93_14795, partial [Saprospiraceae bacterium]